MEHMDHACGMGIALIDHIGLTRHELKETSSYSQANKYRLINGVWVQTETDDTDKLKSLGDNKRYRGAYNYQGGSNTQSNTTTVRTPTKDEQLNFEIVKYIVNRYDGHILAIKNEVLEAVKSVCEKSNIDFSLFENEIAGKFNHEIKF